MFLRYKKPVTPSLRHWYFLDNSHLEKVKTLKTQSFYLKNTGGRNNKGRITVYTKGGGHKKKYRLITYFRDQLEGIVEGLEYDPNRTGAIARVFSKKFLKHFYILASSDLKKGHYVKSHLIGSDSKDFRLRNGDFYFLRDLPVGVFIYNISFSSKVGGCARAAGCSAQIISKTLKHCRLRLSSGEQRLFPLDMTASLGKVSNELHLNVSLGKAGRSIWLNKRPSVRGVAMNPIDHPHGGGEGKTSGGRPSVTPWGKVAHGQPTKKKKNKLVITIK